VKWFVTSTVGPQSLLTGVFSAGWSTAPNQPEEYGPHWEGFGKRYGIRLTGIATGNVMEGGLGAIWGEDPRYFRAPHESFKGRIRNVMKYTIVAKNRNGDDRLAYARLIGIPAGNFASNAWRADSASGAPDAAYRSGIDVLSRLGGNAFREFWPDVRRKLFHRNRNDTQRRTATTP